MKNDNLKNQELLNFFPNYKYFEKFYQKIPEQNYKNFFSEKSYFGFVKFCLENIENLRKIKLPTIKNDNNNLSIVFIEFEELPHIEYILRNNIIKFSNKANYFVICGNNNFNMINTWKLPIKIIKKNINKQLRGDYSLMLSSVDFWNQFFSNFVLISNKNSLILKNEIEEFYSYNYIGTPWLKPFKEDQLFQGDGSFSLRNRKIMIEICSKFNINKMEQNLKPIKYMNEDDKNICIEDVYFSFYLLKFKPLTPYEICKKFSIYLSDNLPIGISNFYNKINWKDYLDFKILDDFLKNEKKILENKWISTDFLFDIAMIVYIPSKERVENYHKNNKNNNINLFQAIDAKNEFEKWKNYGLENKFFTEKYLKKIERPSKIGCNLSHQLLLKEFSKKSSKEWLLVLEDDIDFLEDLNILNNICKEAKFLKSNFIQLVVYKNFREKQLKIKNESKNLKKMIKQWGTASYLINKSIISKITIIDENIDLFYSNNINNFNSTFYDSKIICEGSESVHDETKKKFGSIIWEK